MLGAGGVASYQKDKNLLQAEDGLTNERPGRDNAIITIKQEEGRESDFRSGSWGNLSEEGH